MAWPWGGVETRLAHANLAGAIRGCAISVAALSVSLAMLVAIAVMIGSFRETVDLLGGADAARRPVRRHGAALEPRRAGHHLGGPRVGRRRRPGRRGRRSLPGADVPFRDRLIVLGAGDFRVLLDHGALVFKAPRDGAAVAAHRRSAATSSWSRRACRCGSASASASTLSCRRLPGRAASASPRSTSTTRPIAASWSWTARPSSATSAIQRPTSLSVYLRAGRDAETRAVAAHGQLGAAHRAVHPHQHDRCERKCCASSTPRSRSPTGSRPSPSWWPCLASRAR